ncbi:MAG: flagellar motor switch protein FliM [Christensenellales bacterium]|jgi:flagellar motor switch protein FliM
MKGTLSQREIDELLQKAAESAQDIEKLRVRKEERVKPYDFRKPNKFSRDQIRTLHDIHTDFARFSAVTLSDWLRVPCYLELQYIEEQTFFEYTNTLLNFSGIGVVSVPELEGDILLELSNSAAVCALDIMMGGTASSPRPKKQGFTEIEFILLRKVMEQFIASFRNAWIHYIELRPSLTRIETNGQRVQITNPGEIVFIVTFRISIGQVEGILNCCIPAALLDPVSDKLDRRNRFSIVKTPRENNEEILRENIKDTSVELRCELGKSYLTIDDINLLQPGDVIKTTRQVGEPVEIACNSLIKFKGEVGVRSGKYAVRILSGV